MRFYWVLRKNQGFLHWNQSNGSLLISGCTWAARRVLGGSDFGKAFWDWGRAFWPCFL